MNAWVLFSVVRVDSTAVNKMLTFSHFSTPCTHTRNAVLCLFWAKSFNFVRQLNGWLHIIITIAILSLPIHTLTHTGTYRGWNVKRAFFFISLCHCVYCIMCTCMYDVYFEYSFFYCSFIFIVRHSNANAWNIRFYHVTHSEILRVYKSSHIHTEFSDKFRNKTTRTTRTHILSKNWRKNSSFHSNSVAFYWLLKRIERSERAVKNETCFISFRSFFLNIQIQIWSYYV